MNDPQQLVEAYFDRDLTPEETAQLRGWLAASEENRRSFAHDAMLYLGLPDALQEAAVSEEISDRALLRSLDSEASSPAENFLEVLQSLSPDDEQLPVVDITDRVMQEVAQARYEARRAKAMQQARKEAQLAKDVKPAGTPAWAIYGGAIAACLAVALVVWRPSPPARPTNSIPPPVAETQRPTSPAPPHAPAPVAKVLSTVRAVGPGGVALQPEQTLYGGAFTLDSGLAQLAFEDGAVVTVQGPARLRLEDAGRLVLESGQLVARSDAGQFVVETPRGTVTDLGTAFGVVYQAGRLEAHTFEGLIEVSRTDVPGQAAVSLRAGGAIGIDDTGVQAMQADALRFVSEKEYAVHRRAESGDAEARWAAAAYELRRHPGLILYLSPDVARSAGLAASINLTGSDSPGEQRQRGSASDDALVASLQGRSVFHFDEASDRLTYQLPESYQNLTLSCWVQVPANPRIGLHALVMAGGDSPGDLHWQLSHGVAGGWTGRLGCFHEITDQGHHLFQDMDTALPNLSPAGSWVHLTTTIDVAGGVSRTYVNGQLSGSQPLMRSDQVCLGEVQVGNWNRIPGVGDFERFLDSAISDLAIFDVTLSDQEVKELYETTVRP